MAVLLLALGLASLGLAPAGRAQDDKPLLAYSARIAGDDQRARLIVAFDRKPVYSVHYVAAPPRIIVDLPDTAFGFPDDALTPRGLMTDVRYGKMDATSARLVITTAKPARLAGAEVEPDETGKGFLLVLDTEAVSAAAFETLVRDQDWKSAAASGAGVGKRAEQAAATAAAELVVIPGVIPSPDDDSDFVIAVDAGHGGIDTGAIGQSGTEEKDITLAFARAFASRLGKEKGVKAFLTRTADTFLSLSERVKIARDGGAHLFVSFHADKLKQADIRGATVYTISDRASDSLAESAAARENFSDELAGITQSGEPTEVADILLDLTRRETQAFSVAFARSVVSSFEGQVGLINNPHRYAGFRVLQAPDVPSILLELGFLSNKEDEKLLTDPAWQTTIADLLTKAVLRYRETAVANGG